MIARNLKQKERYLMYKFLIKWKFSKNEYKIQNITIPKKNK